MKTTIAIEGIRCYSHHGCLSEELKIGGNFLVDIYIEKDISKAVWNDRLEDTVDYVTINNIVQAEMAIPSKLIEHAGGRILHELSKAIPGKKSIKLKINKLNPPVHSALDRTFVILEEDYQ